MAIAKERLLDDDDLYPSSDGEPMGETDKHARLTMYLLMALELFFRNRPDAYVAGDNFLYWEQGNPKQVVSPDCYVVFGVEKRLRDTYLAWREGGKLPNVVIEVTSKKTKSVDTKKKFAI